MEELERNRHGSCFSPYLSCIAWDKGPWTEKFEISGQGEWASHFTLLGPSEKMEIVVKMHVNCENQKSQCKWKAIYDKNSSQLETFEFLLESENVKL